MEEDTSDNEAPHIFCYKLPEKKEYIWLYTVVPSALSWLLHIASLLLDAAVAYRLVWAEDRVETGLITFTFIYMPVVFTLILKPPKPPHDFTLLVAACWLFKELASAVISPIITSVSLLKRLLWTISAVGVKKPYEEILHEYEVILPKEVHSYLFLQAFLQCAPQAILQMHLLILGVTTNKFTDILQGMSILVALVTVAYCTALFHRYEAQVVGGRPSVLLMNPPELHGSYLDSSIPFLPIRFCLRSKITGLELDCPLGKVVAFCAWFFLIFGRILCLVISHEIYPNVTIVSLSIHFSIILLYLFSSQSTNLYDIPSRLINATFSLITLVEVSVRFHKIPLLYALFFICIFVEDTFLMILFFVYNSFQCSANIINCSYFSVYSYLIINSHVIGIVLFGIYLAGLRPRRKSLITTSPSAINIELS